MEVAIQPTFTCSKLTIETLEQGVKYVQSYLVNFDQVIFGWAARRILDPIKHL